MSAWINAHWFALSGTCKRMMGSPGSTLLNALVLAIALTLPLVGYSLLTSLNPVTRNLAADPEITVFLQINTSRDQALSLQSQLSTIVQGKAQYVELLKREKALDDLKSQPAYSDVLTALPSNPFPDAIIVRFKNEEDIAATIEQYEQRFKSLPGVHHVQIDSAWVKRLEAGLRFLRRGLTLLAAALAIAVIAVVFNTIRLQVLTKHDEIVASQLVGATDAFVARPFYYLGVLYGSLAALVALALTWGALRVLSTAIVDLARTYGSTFSLSLPGYLELLVFVLIAAALGWLGAAFSVAKYLRLG